MDLFQVFVEHLGSASYRCCVVLFKGYVTAFKHLALTEHSEGFTETIIHYVSMQHNIFKSTLKCLNFR